MLRMLSTTIVFLLCLALAWFALACAMQRSLLFPAPPAGGPDLLARIPGAEQLWLDTPGARAEAWFLPPLSRGASAAARAPRTPRRS